MRTLYVLLACCAVMLVPLGHAHGQAIERYKIRLTTVPMDGGMRNTVAGFGSGTATLAGNKLSVSGTFDGLKSPATTGALKGGVARGVRGNPIGDLAVSKATRGTVTGAVELTPEQLKALREGHLYIEIASEKAPDGNLWGWILK